MKLINSRVVGENLALPSFEELHRNDVYRSRYVTMQLTAACPNPGRLAQSSVILPHSDAPPAYSRFMANSACTLARRPVLQALARGTLMPSVLCNTQQLLARPLREQVDCLTSVARSVELKKVEQQRSNLRCVRTSTPYASAWFCPQISWVTVYVRYCCYNACPAARSSRFASTPSTYQP